MRVVFDAPNLERAREIKHRTRVVRIFPNSEPCLRLVTASYVDQSEEVSSMAA